MRPIQSGSSRGGARLWWGVLPHRNHIRVFYIASMLIYSLPKQLDHPKLFLHYKLYLPIHTHIMQHSFSLQSLTHTVTHQWRQCFLPRDYSLYLTCGLQCQESNYFLTDRWVLYSWATATYSKRASSPQSNQQTDKATKITQIYFCSSHCYLHWKYFSHDLFLFVLHFFHLFSFGLGTCCA